VLVENGRVESTTMKDQKTTRKALTQILTLVKEFILLQFG